MSMRGTKRAAGVRGEDTGTSKRRRTEPEDALWQLRPVSDLKMSSIYNRSASEAPAELFRKDLISAMKLPDNEPLTPAEYWIITDTWKQDWERGVQVPVNPDSLPAPKVKVIDNPLPPNFQEFKLPKDKFIHLQKDSHYQSDIHHVSVTVSRAEASCNYDLDATDSSWLKLLNAERARAGAAPVTEDQLERVIEELEIRTWDKIQAIIKSEEGLGIEYDENVICDVCRSPDSEDGNEMVFCDSCNICVHQACYGITVIPPGQWLCRPCRDGVRDASCILCPNLGGAMKCTPSGHKWAHVSCVLWIPEVSIGCAEKMEPITKISAIPTSRWALLCVLCRERKGACIQCSVKTCKTAYHVTCAFKHGLEMRAIIEDENADDGVKLRSYCQKHSVNSKKEKGAGSGSDEEEVKRKRRKDMTSEEKNQARAARLQEIEREFDRHVSVKDISTHLLDVDQDAIFYIYNYWKLKRRAGHNRPLLPPKSDDTDLLSHRQEQADLDKMKMFVQLRQDLERVRNLCYMVSRREKLSRSFFRYREQTFHKQVSVLSTDKSLSSNDLSAIIEANHGPSIYDRLYSHPDAPDHKNDFDELLARIAGPDSTDDKKKDVNGLAKGAKGANPYKKHYVNGSTRRSGSIYSGLSSEESAPEISRSTSKYRGRAIGSSTEDELPKRKIGSPKKKISPKAKGKKSPRKTGKKKTPQSKAIVETSSEDESIQSTLSKDKTRSKTLQQMEKEMTAGKIVPSGTESDDLIPIRTTRNNKFTVDIYSDSSENEVQVKSDTVEGYNTDKSPSATNDSLQPLPRTKAAMKEFVPTQPAMKVEKVEPNEPKKRGRKPSSSKDKKLMESEDDIKIKDEVKSKKTKDNPTDLIVPQRQAAKKASENMRSTTTAAVTATKSKDEAVLDKHFSGDEMKPKSKVKQRKESKESVKDKESPVKEGTKRKSSCDADKETIAYVPQRQAAKKAAAHIKSGLGSKAPTTEAEDKKKDGDKIENIKKSPKKDEEKLPNKSSSSSSSNSSSSSYSSSSSSDEEDKSETKPSVKTREIKPTRQPSIFSPTGTRPTVDLPFLDKVSRPLSSTSASSDSESSKGSRFSGSDSPIPKRPRRRRKGKNESTDVSPRKAPDKKLKTSERGSMCGVPSPTSQGEEQGRTNDTRAATRARTRSTTSSGNMLNKCDTRSRKPSKDEPSTAIGPNKTRKEASKPSELPIEERKKDETLNKSVSETERNEDSETPVAKSRRLSSYKDDKDKKAIDDNKTSPSKKTSLSKRGISKDVATLEMPSASIKERRASKHESQQTSVSRRSSSSPTKKPSTEKKSSPLKLSDSYQVHDKNWFPKAPSPNVQPPPIEKPGGHEKYMTDDKSLDADATDKSSIRMIAKIQATLNENTMIKSPKTPMDARTLNLDSIDVEHPLSRNVRKRPLLEAEKKFSQQDSSHLQGVEISKSAKIPSAQFPNISLFSPPSKENEMYDIEMIHLDEEPFPSYPETLFLQEDSKEQGVQETLNLVDRLRMQLSSKKVSTDNSSHDEVMANNEEKDDAARELISDKHTEDGGRRESGNTPQLLNRSPHKENIIDNHRPNSTPPIDLTPRDVKKSIPIIDKWPELPPTPRIDSHVRHAIEKQYESMAYALSIKDTTNTHSDMQSTSEIDRDTLSKQSDDSQSLSVVDNSVHSNDKESVSHDNQNYDNNNSLIHSDCATISSPYVSLYPDLRRESKITRRHSSASSTNSEGSICSQKTDTKSHILSCDARQGNAIPDIESYPALPAYSCPIEPPMPLNQYSSYQPDASPFISSMASLPLFPPGSCPPTGMPLPTPGPVMYSSSLPVPFSSNAPLMPPLDKPYSTLCAAFTSSSQNMALTTEMIAPPTPKPTDSPRDDIDLSGSDKFSIHVVSSPSIDSLNESCGPRNLASKMSNENSNETIINPSSQEPKSPVKVVKAAQKLLTHQTKSPGKSPGFSPINDTSKTTKRPNNRNTRNQRGKTKSKSRGQNVHSYSSDFSIQSNLVGTVYDFDEEIANDSVDIKALRDKRKSVDIHDRKIDNLRDSSQSPHVTSPHNNKKALQVSETRETKVPSPVEELQKCNVVNSPRCKSSSETGQSPAVHPAVQPVLPGPVNMRTYQTAESAPPAAAATVDNYHSRFLAFGTTDQPLAEIYEEDEKQLQKELMASKQVSPAKIVQPVIAEPTVETFEPQLPKVSLSDSRNQLKVKIKGPFLDANYSASSVQSVAPQPPAPILDSSTNMASNIAGNSMMSGTTNLRRMRKKELLRQYWTQDMNMDEPINSNVSGMAPPPAVPPPLSRAVITIPKAVASMTSIPTREDYKGVSDTNEKKKRKTTSGLSRELRHLEVGMNDDVDTADDRHSFTSNHSHKRRGRVSNKPNKSTSPVAPKLKIKLGNIVQNMSTDDQSGFQFRPPKKRLASIPKPSIEELRRDSMKYRRKVMADFEEDEKTKKHKPGKSDKRKKKKDKKAEKLQVVNSESESATKLIIKIKRSKEEEARESKGPECSSVGAVSGVVAGTASGEPAVPVDPFEYDPTAQDPLAIDPPSYAEASSAMRKIRTAKVTPIRLKLSRSAEGSSYVMKGGSDAAESAADVGQPSSEQPLSLAKHCEVR